MNTPLANYLYEGGFPLSEESSEHIELSCSYTHKNQSFEESSPVQSGGKSFSIFFNS